MDPWSYKIDALELNDWEKWIVESAPGMENGMSYTDVQVDMQGDVPEFDPLAA